jgi:cytochrome c oxidase subunit 3
MHKMFFNNTNKKTNFIQSTIYASDSYPKHPYHLVTPSPWPFLGGLAALTLTTGGVMFMHAFAAGKFALFFGQVMLWFVMWVWWRDVIREATFEGLHTTAVQKNHRIGMILFIVSEIMFFFAFFWAYFHASIIPGIQIGATWPPQGIDVFNPWEVPLLNTMLLLLSGFSVTWCHHCIVAGYRKEALVSLTLTVILACFFTGFQILEYVESPFHISDSVYGSTFFMATGFHGLHVQIGTLFLFICAIRLHKGHFTRQHHFGFEAAAWYWHFVDVVWLFLFCTVYWWGGMQ